MTEREQLIQSDTPGAAGASNHPLAVRMGVIAAVGHNMVVGCIFGTFGVMLASVVQRMDVSTEQAAIGVPLVIIGSSILASFVGVLVAKFSLRLMLLTGALLSVLAFVVLAFTNNYFIYLAAYGLLLGPGMAMAGSVGPATLVTRWFTQNRGLALGLVHLPIIVAILPVASNWVFEHYGAKATYLMLAALVGIVLVPMTLAVIDHPPGQQAVAADSTARTADGSLSMGQLLARPRFWAFALASAAIITGAVTLGAVLIPMAESWGIERSDAALLASIMSLVGMVGSVLFGWVADRIGGARGLALLAFASAILWGALLLRPPFPVLAVIIGLIGMCGAGTIPNLSRGISDTFGQASFSRGFGLATTISLPFTVLAVPGFPFVYSTTGSYSPAIMALVAFYAVSFLFALGASRR